MKLTLVVKEVNGVVESVVEKSLSEKDLKALEEIDKISTYEKFKENLGKLSRALISQTMGKDKDQKLIDKLEKMKKRI